MRTRICCFCNIQYYCSGSKKLLEAYVPKRKRIYYHLDCVQWSLGFLRKKYNDQDIYVCHLYDSTCNKLCSICNKCNPTIKGEYSHQYYHYHCALENNIPLSLSRYVDFVDYFNEQRKIIEIEKTFERRLHSEIEKGSSNNEDKRVSTTPTTVCEVNNISEAEPLSLEECYTSIKRRHEERGYEMEKENKRMKKSVLHITDNIQNNGYSVYNDRNICEVDTFLLSDAHQIHNIENDSNNSYSRRNSTTTSNSVYPSDYYIINNYSDDDNSSVSNYISNSNEYVYFSNIVDIENNDERNSNNNNNNSLYQYMSDIGRISSEDETVTDDSDDYSDDSNDSLDGLEPLSYGENEIHSIVSKLISFQ